MTIDSGRMRRLIAQAGLLGCALMAAIVFSSAFLRLKTIGIGCEDWPACYGRVSQASGEGGSAIRRTQDTSIVVARLLHRASAMLVAVVALFVLLLALTREGRNPANLSIAVALCILTAALAAIGRASAGTLIPLIGVANLVGGFSMLALFWVLALRNAPVRTGRMIAGGPARVMAYVLVALLAVHIAMGALVSVTYSAPLCAGSWSCLSETHLAGVSLRELNPAAALSVDAANRVIAPLGAAKLQLVHRLLGVCIGGGFIVLGVLLSRGREHRALGIVMAAIALAEVLLGTYMVSANFPLVGAVLHNLTAAALLLVAVTFAFRPGAQESGALD
jgi:cytochrome c oxidase assembly protein subunit 15